MHNPSIQTLHEAPLRSDSLPYPGVRTAVGNEIPWLQLSHNVYMQPPSANLQEKLILESLLARRDQFVDILTSQKLIPAEYVQSERGQNVLNSFAFDVKTGNDALIHTLIGDGISGFHHEPTGKALEKAGLTHYTRQVMRQKSYSNGVYIADVRFLGKPGERPNFKKGSPFFPESWSVQQVIEAIHVATTRAKGEIAPRNDSERYQHDRLVGDVSVRAITEKIRTKDADRHTTMNDKNQPKPYFIIKAGWPSAYGNR